jgi:NADPH-dependent 2,4-dienoyl-CoA reductase/sulfur reductase-like enzyme
MATSFPSISILLNRIGDIITPNKQDKPQVVVVGSGWGASAFVDTINTRKYNVRVVSPSLARLNQPRMIADFEPSSTPLRIKPELDYAVAVDKHNKKLVCQKNIYSYDYLVIATGSEPNDFGIKGVKEYCLMFKTGEDLEKLKANLKTQEVTVLGAGPTGIELAFKLQTMGYTVKLIEASDTILPGFSNIMKSRCQALLDERNIKVLSNTKVKEVNETHFITSNGKIPRDKVSVWTCGVRPTSFVRDMAFGKAFSTTNVLMAYPYIYALGDIVAAKGPPTAQNAKQQGKYLANHFNNNFKSEQDYTYNEKGRVIDIGNGLLIEYGTYVVKLPSIFRNIFYAIVS